MKIKDILSFLDEKAPFRTAESFDNVGLLIGSENADVSRVMCCLDITRGAVVEAAEKGAGLIVSHHPVIFSGLKSIPEWNPVKLLIENNISAIAMHTNLDIAKGGVNDKLIEKLGFEKLETLEVTQADGSGFGAVCDCGREFSVRELALHCQKITNGCVQYSANVNRTIKRAAVCCGAGIDENVMQLAQEKNCDAVISGDIKHNFRIEAENRGIALIDAGHFHTEQFAGEILSEMLSERFNELDVFVYENEKSPFDYV